MVGVGEMVPGVRAGSTVKLVPEVEEAAVTELASSTVAQK